MAKKEREAKGKQYRPKNEADTGPAPKPKPQSRRARKAIEAREPKLVSLPAHETAGCGQQKCPVSVGSAAGADPPHDVERLSLSGTRL